MGKAQKITAVVSVILILALAAVLGIFLWKESRAEQQTGGGCAVEHVRGDDSADGGDSQPSLDDVGGGENDRLAADGTGTGISEEEPETYEEEQDMLDTKKVTEISMVFTGDVLLSDNVGADMTAAAWEGFYLRICSRSWHWQTLP